MFTGIVEEVGTVRSFEGRRLEIACRTVSADSPVGASLCVAGVCLTVVDGGDGALSFDLSEETLARTGLSGLAPGETVNLERPVTLATRLGGHLVQGHVDGVGEVQERREAAGSVEVWVRVPEGLELYVVEKGSIAVDGVSLTVSGIREGAFAVSLIPHTLAVTTLGKVAVGTRVNVEVDLIAKYVQRLMEGRGA
jgi:riboflavin synthase